MTWYSHEYARAFGAGIHATPAVWDVGHMFEPQTLIERLNASLPGKTMRVVCSGTALLVEVETTDFDAGELTTVAADIAAQKAVTDWPAVNLNGPAACKTDFAKPVASKASTLLAAKSGDGNAAPDAQPKYPVNVICVAASDGGSMDVDVTVTGVRADGKDDTEVITLDAGDGDYPGNKAWASISDVAYAGTWDGANITFKNGDKLGIPHACCSAVYKETFDGAPQAVGTFDATYGTYVPTGTPDGAKALEVWTKPEGFLDS